MRFLVKMGISPLYHDLYTVEYTFVKEFHNFVQPLYLDIAWEASELVVWSVRIAWKGNIYKKYICTRYFKDTFRESLSSVLCINVLTRINTVIHFQGFQKYFFRCAFIIIICIAGLIKRKYKNFILKHLSKSFILK